MSEGFVLRPLSATDGPALAGLSYTSPDSGGIRYAANYQIDAYQAVQAIHGDVEAVGACLPGSFRLAGAALVRYGRCLFEGEERPFGLLGNLIVHPDYRGRGLAAKLVEWQMAQASSRVGDEGVILTNFQGSNKASQQIFTRWLGPARANLLYLPLATLADAPASSGGILAGPLDESEYRSFAFQLNEFYCEYNLHQPASAASLNALVQRTPFSGPFRHAYGAVDARGKLLAGCMVMEEYRLKHLEIRGLPRLLRLLNDAASLLPKDGMLREVYLDHIWFAAGQSDACRQLIETIQWVWHGRASHVSLMFDPRGPLRQLFQTRPWTIRAWTSVAARGPRSMNPKKLVAPIY